MTDELLVKWAVNEIRELDELCRSQIGGYGPLTSDDMAIIKKLEALATRLYDESKAKKVK